MDRLRLHFPFLAFSKERIDSISDTFDELFHDAAALSAAEMAELEQMRQRDQCGDVVFSRREGTGRTAGQRRKHEVRITSNGCGKDEEGCWRCIWLGTE